MYTLEANKKREKMVTKSYMMDMGVQINFEVVTIYPQKKIGKEMVEQRHLEPLSKTTTFSVKDRGETHPFNTIEDVMEFLPTTEMYQARLAYEIEHGYLKVDAE